MEPLRLAKSSHQPPPHPLQVPTNQEPTSQSINPSISPSPNSNPNRRRAQGKREAHLEEKALDDGGGEASGFGVLRGGRSMRDGSGTLVAPFRGDDGEAEEEKGEGGRRGHVTARAAPVG